MAVPANTVQTYTRVGNREDLSDLIKDISPTETPFQANAKRGSATAVLHEWQTRSLAAAAQNAHIQGDDSSATNQAPTTRLGNRLQISKKVYQVSGTQESVTHAGIPSMLGEVRVNNMKELKRDREKILLDSNPAVAGDASTATELGGLPNFLKTNTDREAGGADPSYTSVPSGAVTDGTPRAFTEGQFKTVAQAVWEAGGNPSILMVGGFNKTQFSGFSGIAAARVPVTSQSQTMIVGGADVYVGDFGNYTVVPNRFQRGRDAFLLDPSLVSVDYLRPEFAEKLAKTGDSDKEHIVCEYTLRVDNEAGLGIVADLTTS